MTYYVIMEGHVPKCLTGNLKDAKKMAEYHRSKGLTIWISKPLNLIETK